MTQKEKELLLKDLSARLPYGVICEVKITAKYSDAHKPSVSTWKGSVFGITTNEPNTAWVYSFITIYPCGPKQNICSIEECKPYLRPMSSMTKEEKKKLGKISCEGNIEHKYGIFYRSQDYLNSIHVDFRRLIEKGLAIEAPEGMYN